MSTLIECGASPFIPGFALKDVRLENGLTVRVAIGGSGSPLVLLHGHPQNHTTWRKVAPTLAQNHTVILPDLRGYGDSDKPTSDPAHRTYSKRTMAQDIVMLMDALGFSRFAFVGHDRGGRVGHRLALDYPDRVTCCTFIAASESALLSVTLIHDDHVPALTNRLVINNSVRKLKSIVLFLLADFVQIEKRFFGVKIELVGNPATLVCPCSPAHQ